MSTIAAQPGLVRRRTPPLLIVPAAFVALLVIAPLAYLVLRASEATADDLGLLVFRWRNLALLGNTLGLTVSVLALSTAIALPLAWLTARSDLPGRRLLSLAAVTPLAVPGYLMAYTLLSLGGYNGTVAQLTGWQMPRLSGFWGATLALGLYNMPYMFLNLRVALARMDVSLEEAARSLGRSPLAVFRTVVLPQLRPALGAGSLLVALHVIGDFGVVSLMRYESFSYALYLQYDTGFDRTYSAWLALMLIGVAALPLIIEFRFLRGLRFDPVVASAARRRRPVRLGFWRWPAIGFVALVTLVAVVVPVSTIIYWCVRGAGPSDLSVGGDWWPALRNSVSASMPAALLATGLALPIAYAVCRYPGLLTRAFERLAYIGYAVPALSFALALVFFSSRVRPWVPERLDWPVMFGLLVLGYAIHFLAESVGPIRSSLYVATPRLEEASRTLGLSRLATLRRVTLPLLRPGLVVGAALVFLSAMKELPLTLLVAPLDYPTLATEVWTYTADARFAVAAPYALTIVVFSAMFVGLLLMTSHGESEPR